MCDTITVISVIAQLYAIVFRKTKIGGMSVISIDLHSRVPVYEQIEEQIIWLINSGVYAADDKLPSIRSLASELKLNVNTVKRAFQDL